LKEKLQSLQSALEQKELLIADLQRQTNRPPPDRQWRNPTNWMEQLKKDDPKRYEEMVKAREEARQKVNRSFAEKADYLLKRDKSKLSEEEQAQHEQMVSLLNDTWLMAEKLRTDNLPREERFEAMRTMRDNMRTLEPMMDKERDRALYDVGKQVGYTDKAAQDFVQYMNDLIEVTSMRDIYQNMRRGGGGPEGPGGPGGRGTGGARPPGP
jgi:hypothetical protein